MAASVVFPARRISAITARVVALALVVCLAARARAAVSTLPAVPSFRPLRLAAASAAFVRSLSDYNRKRRWPQGAEAAQKIEWLSTGSGCTERFGTVYDTHIAAWSALSAALSIIVDVPLERDEDAEAHLATLTYTGWRHLPCHQQPYVARRMARFVSDRIMGQPFVPMGAR
jgi:hypothetical protein